MDKEGAGETEAKEGREAQEEGEENGGAKALLQ